VFVCALLLSITAGAPGARAARHADDGNITLTVRQIISNASPSATHRDTFSYSLTPKRSSNPMPAGSDANSYDFTIAGNDERSIGPISFSEAGVYDYDITHTDDSRPGYTSDYETYSLKVYVDSDLSTTIIARKDDGSKAGNISYKHTLGEEYGGKPSNPYGVINPPIVKTVSGKPPKDARFAFELVAADPESPMPTGSVNGVSTAHITGSGRTEFGTWSYTREGVYYYTIREADTGDAEYTYDSTVYAIIDTVFEADGELQVSRVITNGANKPVTSISFINKYNALKPEPTPAGTPGGMPKTGDDINVTRLTILFCTAWIVALGCAAILLISRRRGKADK